LSFRRKPESSDKAGCRIKSGMTSLDIVIAGVIKYFIDIDRFVTQNAQFNAQGIEAVNYAN